MNYIEFKGRFYINKEPKEEITQTSFLVQITTDEDGIWHRVNENNVILFSRYVDGYLLLGDLPKFNKFKIKTKKFKGINSDK